MDIDERLRRYDELVILMQEEGLKFVFALIVLIAGLLLIKWAVKYLKVILVKLIKNPHTLSIVGNSVGVILLGIVIIASAMEIGAKPGPLIAFIMIIILVVIGIIVIFRPLLPTLPFKVGNTVKIGDLLGKVEATTILNTRLRTFDGKTFFVPNRQIINDIVINYHFTQTRRVKIDVSIRYDQDLMKAKQLLEAVMTADPRVLRSPSPQVYVLNLAASSVELGGRYWVDNSKYWVAKCELQEKVKLRFDTEGIEFAYPQLDINHRTSLETICRHETDLENV